jgi:hypothetical protein
VLRCSEFVVVEGSFVRDCRGKGWMTVVCIFGMVDYLAIGAYGEGSSCVVLLLLGSSRSAPPPTS